MLLLSNEFGISNSVSEVGWVVVPGWLMPVGHIFIQALSFLLCNQRRHPSVRSVCVCANQEHDPLSVFQEEISTNETEVQRIGEPNAKTMW